MAASTFPISEAELKEWIAQSVAEVFRERADELIAQKLAAFVTENERRARELALMKRGVRVEEELKDLREVQMAHFQATEKRFEAMDNRLKKIRMPPRARTPRTSVSVRRLFENASGGHM
ncbi:MAG: hypothetical protein ACUVSA_09800 [Desulfosoma sp.]|uniref:hypothetical protein n=1 Tax=Desulfosoma sp. TaxID=2603217 RepID=UPI0040499EF3